MTPEQDKGIPDFSAPKLDPPKGGFFCAAAGTIRQGSGDGAGAGPHSNILVEDERFA